MTTRPSARPVCWHRTYRIAQRIDKAGDALAGVGLSVGLIVACGLIRASDTWRMWVEALGELGCVDLPEDETDHGAA